MINRIEDVRGESEIENQQSHSMAARKKKKNTHRNEAKLSKTSVCDSK